MLDQLPNTQEGRFALIGLFNAAINQVRLPKAKTACALVDDDDSRVASVAIGVTNPNQPQRATIAAITDPDYQNHGYGSDAVTELARQLVSEGVIEFDADISPSNLASERLAQHLAQHAPSGIKTLFRNLMYPIN
jgi:RimJ/RimL family protein N-acetyltransferase